MQERVNEKTVAVAVQATKMSGRMIARIGEMYLRHVREKRRDNKLTKSRDGKGFSRSNVVYIRKLYLVYPNSQALSDQLSFSHYIELLKIEDPLERSFYEKECISEHWGVRELQRQMKSMLFHRIAMSGDKNEVLRLAQEGQIIEKPEDILKEPYVFEFTGLPQLPVY